MSSAGANVNHLDHVSTQLPYALTVGGLSFVMFLVAGFVQNAAICLLIGIVLTIATLIVLKRTIGSVPTDAAGVPAGKSTAETN